MAETVAYSDSSLDAVSAIFDLLRLREESTALPAPNWSRPLPRPVVIPDVMCLGKLADVWALIEKHLPTEYRTKFS